MKLNLLLQRGAVLTLILVEMIAAPLLIHAQAQTDQWIAFRDHCERHWA
jgi:hypothetical protein